jgi:hypothetical protein
MKNISLMMIYLLVISAAVLGEDDLPSARSVLERYFAMPLPAGLDQGFRARVAVLAELKTMPHGAVLASEEVLFNRATPLQRNEIVSALGDYIHTAECAQLLYRVLKDVRAPENKQAFQEEVLVRSSAVRGLRKMASRTNRSGGKRNQTGPNFEPKVPGILPYLIFATKDESEKVRISALYGLADSRDPAAPTELRRCLKDPSWDVRLYAACFLTEYDDATGLAEMCKAASQPPKTSPIDFAGYVMVEQILASFERITRKSFGEIPMNPILSSDSNANADASKRYKELFHEWEVWCGQQPNQH